MVAEPWKRLSLGLIYGSALIFPGSNGRLGDPAIEEASSGGRQTRFAWTPVTEAIVSENSVGPK